jgi:hypothetical protein
MFVRFTTESGAAARNYGFQEALKATATANSGFTPSLPGGCIDYQVLSNDEGGGWVENLDACDPLTSATDTSGTYSIMSDLSSKDFGIEDMSKHLKIDFDQTGGNFEQVRPGFKIPDGTYSTNTNPFFVSTTIDLDDVVAQPTSWFLSITSEYCWVWENGVGIQPFFGVADLDGVPPAYKSTSNYWAPFTFLATYDGANHKRIQANFPTNGIFTAQKGLTGQGPLTEGVWKTADANSSETLTLFSATPELTIYTYDGTGNPGNVVYHKSINTNGEYTDSLNPLAFYAPFSNFPYMPIKGIKAVGRFSGASQSDVTNAADTYKQYINKIVYDENGERYMIVHSNYWAPVAFRCV